MSLAMAIVIVSLFVIAFSAAFAAAQLKQIRIAQVIQTVLATAVTIRDQDPHRAAKLVREAADVMDKLDG